MITKIPNKNKKMYSILNIKVNSIGYEITN